MWYIHTMEYYSDIKSNEVLLYATTWINLRNFMPCERSQTQRPYIIWSHLYEMSKIDKSIESESRLVIAGGLMGEGNWD